METTETIIPLVFSAIALALSGVTFIFARRFENADNKRALSVAMWERWENVALRDQRVLVWNALAKHLRDLTENTDTISYKVLTADERRALNDVERFLDALSNLNAGDRLDVDLVRRLFRPNIDQWAGYSERILRDDTEQVKSAKEIADMYERLASLKKDRIDGVAS